ncbi:hypothetical protein PHVU103714_07560 [Phocaeicola vulgatus]
MLPSSFSVACIPATKPCNAVERSAVGRDDNTLESTLSNEPVARSFDKV